MTLEEACALLDISPDEDLDIDQLEENYNAKTANLAPGSREHKRIDEACEYLIDVYDEIYSVKENAKKTNVFLIALTISMTMIAAASLLGVMYFMYIRPPVSNNSPDKNYEKLLNEIENLKNKSQDHIVANNTPKSDTRDYADLIEKIMPSIVFILTSKGTGSGFFVSANGDILTNYHVIKNAEYISVITQSGQTFNALVKDFDSNKDMALLKVNTNSTFLNINSSLPKQGEAIVAVGNPSSKYHIYDNTVSNGIVSAIREVDDNLWVQFTASVSPGSSGGALINLHGNVIGMVTWKDADIASQNINFALPSTELRKFLNTAIHKTAKALPQSKPKSKAYSKNFNIPGIKFVGKDDGYEMYLDTENIDYDRQTRTASFITLWWPTEKSKKQMRGNPDFMIPPGEDLGLCLLLYTVNFNANKYAHLRTINLCTDGETIARDYIKPTREITWRTPKKGSRIQLLVNEVKKQLRIK